MDLPNKIGSLDNSLKMFSKKISISVSLPCCCCETNIQISHTLLIMILTSLAEQNSIFTLSVGNSVTKVIKKYLGIVTLDSSNSLVLVFTVWMRISIFFLSLPPKRRFSAFFLLPLPLPLVNSRCFFWERKKFLFLKSRKKMNFKFIPSSSIVAQSGRAEED